METKIKEMKPQAHGWLILDKPLGLTSTQSLGKVRRLIGGKKVGHGGTLDPLASGILPLAFGEATKLIPYVMDGEKEYQFSVRWGQRRSTDDAEGDVVEESDVRPSKAQIQAILSEFTGEIKQIPPIYSAIKVDGERAYDLARGGEKVELQARPVIIHLIELVDILGPDEASFRVECGKGTYVRSLARDMAVRLGTCGYVSALRRTRVGPFRLKDAIMLEKLEELSHKDAAKTALLALRAALDDIPGLALTAGEAQSVRNGQSLLIKPHQVDMMKAPLIWAEHQGTPVALMEARDGMFRILRGFHF